MKKIKSVFDGEEFCKYALLCSTEKHGLNLHMHVVYILNLLFSVLLQHYVCSLMPFFRIMHLAVSSISLVFDQISCGAFVLCGACMFASVFVCFVRLSFRLLTAQKEDKQ